MTTLISIHTSDGCVGRCDAKCYNAKTTDCTCICGGKNHGAGLSQAIDNTRQMAEQWLARYAKERNLKNWHGEIPAAQPMQLSLF